jgi:hypothetical protein
VIRFIQSFIVVPFNKQARKQANSNDNATTPTGSRRSAQFFCIHHGAIRHDLPPYYYLLVVIKVIFSNHQDDDIVATRNERGTTKRAISRQSFAASFGCERTLSFIRVRFSEE